MKKHAKKPLQLARETIRTLDGKTLEQIGGGGSLPACGLGGGGSQSGHYTCTCSGGDTQ
jgi:hypothetical protein